MPVCPTELAGELADLDALVSAPDIVTVAERTGRSIDDAAATFFAAEANFRLDQIIATARSVPANDYFERMAIDRAVEQIAGAERRLAADMLATGQSGQQAAESWLAAHPEATRIRRCRRGDCRQRPDARQADGGGEPAGGPGQGLRACEAAM